MARGLALVTTLLAACASTAPSDPDFDLATALEAGHDPWDTDAAWRAGDECLFRVELTGGETRVWFVRIRVPADAALVPPDDPRAANVVVAPTLQGHESALLPIVAEVYGPDGTFEEASRSLAPEARLRGGLEAASRIASARPSDDGSTDGGVTFYDLRAVQDAAGTLLGIFQVIQHNDALSPILWEVVERPSVLSVLVNGGVDLALSIGEVERGGIEVPLAEPLGTQAGVRVPMALEANDEPALEMSAVACASRPPVQLSGGIVSLEGVHPEDPEHRVEVRLVRARRGGGGQLGP